MISGLFLVLLGIAGLILPIMPGWIFLIPGLIILSDYFRPVKSLVRWAKRQAVKVGDFIEDSPRSAATGGQEQGPPVNPRKGLQE